MKLLMEKYYEEPQLERFISNRTTFQNDSEGLY